DARRPSHHAESGQINRGLAQNSVSDETVERISFYRAMVDCEFGVSSGRANGAIDMGVRVERAGCGKTNLACQRQDVAKIGVADGQVSLHGLLVFRFPVVQ